MQLQETQWARERQQDERLAQIEADRKQEERGRKKSMRMSVGRCKWKEKIRDGKEQKKQVADRITPWTDSEHPTAYLKRFEDIMQENGIGKEQCPSRLIPLLTGQALAAYNYNIPRDAIASYPSFKEERLKLLGMSIERSQHKFWRMQRR